MFGLFAQNEVFSLFGPFRSNLSDRSVDPGSEFFLDGLDKNQEIYSTKHIFDLLDKNFAMILME